VSIKSGLAALRDFDAASDRFGSKARISLNSIESQEVRSASNSGCKIGRTKPSLGAKNALMPGAKAPVIQITSVDRQRCGEIRSEPSPARSPRGGLSIQPR